MYIEVKKDAQSDLPEFKGQFRVCGDEIFIDGGWLYKYKVVPKYQKDYLKTQIITPELSRDIITKVYVLRSESELCDYMPFMDMIGEINEVKAVINFALNCKVYYKEG
jgi:hypothetical protein